MTFTHALSTNNYGPAKFIVSTSAANGTHTTLASALAAASSGDTVFLRDSVTEDVTLPPGVNIASWYGSSLNTPTITGKITMTGAGTCSIDGIHLKTNSDYLLAVTGANSSNINLNNCYIEASNFSALNCTSSGGSRINFYNCNGELGTTGIAYAVITNGGVYFINCDFLNSGVSTTSSTCSGGTINLRNSRFFSPITTSGTGGTSVRYSWIGVTNTTALTLGGSGTNLAECSILESGTSSAISVGASAGVYNCDVSSSNTNAITGAGTLNYSNLTFTGTSSTINTTTQTSTYASLGKYRAHGQPAFSAVLGTTDTNVTGDGTAFTIGSGNALTEIFDQGSDFNTNGIFTAPVNGRYFLQNQIYLTGATSLLGSNFSTVTSNKTYRTDGTGTNGAITAIRNNSTFADMDAGDTATFVITATDTGGKIDDILGNGTTAFTWCSGYLVC